MTEQPSGPPPDYSNPNATQPETTIPASKASIAVIAGLHAMVTLQLLEPTPPFPLPSGRGEKRAEDSEKVSDSQATSFSPSLQGGGRGVGSENKERPSPLDFTSLLFSLQVVPGVFETAYRSHRLRIPRSPTCLVCGTPAPTPTGEQLDAAVDAALARLGVR